MRTALLLPLAVAALALTGCSPDEPVVDPPVPEEPVAEDTQDHCVVGSWSLDVQDYSLQTYNYVVGANGFPIEDWNMNGVGSLTFDNTEGVNTFVDLTTSGTIVVPDRSQLFTTRSAYEGSGRWYLSDVDSSSLNFEDWINVMDPDVPVDPDNPTFPPIDFSDLVGVGIQCTEETLIIQGPDAPVSSLWHRQL